MKKTLLSLVLFSTVLQLSSCAAVESQGRERSVSTSVSAPVLSSKAAPVSSKTERGGVVEIKEKMFIAQLNDIFLNPNDYVGKKIKYEGIFHEFFWEKTGKTYYQVYRKSPGCCGADGQAGFEVVWPKGEEKGFPQIDDWCEVVGTLELYEEDGDSFLHIVLDSLKIKADRGAEFVSQ